MDAPICRICHKKHYGLCTSDLKSHEDGETTGGKVLDKYECAALEHDYSEIDRLKKYLIKTHPAGELEFAGKSVVDWAISNLERVASIRKYHRDYMRRKRNAPKVDC